MQFQSIDDQLTRIMTRIDLDNHLQYINSFRSLLRTRFNEVFGIRLHNKYLIRDSDLRDTAHLQLRQKRCYWFVIIFDLGERVHISGLFLQGRYLTDSELSLLRRNLPRNIEICGTSTNCNGEAVLTIRADRIEVSFSTTNSLL